ncbi:potassium transporter 12-like, partial [Trifolium medium]|nr:potassium transporter 12-like [Trifolium medium]
YANVNMLPNHQPADEHISSYRLKLPSPELKRALDIKETLERNSALKTLLLLLVLLGTSLIIGDGILTPAMSGECFKGHVFSIEQACFDRRI